MFSARTTPIATQKKNQFQENGTAKKEERRKGKRRGFIFADDSITFDGCLFLWYEVNIFRLKNAT